MKVLAFILALIVVQTYSETIDCAKGLTQCFDIVRKMIYSKDASNPLNHMQNMVEGYTSKEKFKHPCDNTRSYECREAFTSGEFASYKINKFISNIPSDRIDISVGKLNCLFGYGAKGEQYDAIFPVGKQYKADILLQVAINYMASRGGGTLHITSGDFDISEMIKLHDNIHIKGIGINKTKFHFKTNHAEFFIKDKNNVSISDLTIIGNKQNLPVLTISGYGIYVLRSKSIYFDRLRVTNTHNNGITIGDSADITITNTIVDGCGWSGFDIKESDVRIIDSSSFNNLGNGFEITLGKVDSIFINNEASFNGWGGYRGFGFSASMSHNLQLSDNKLFNNEDGNLCLWGSEIYLDDKFNVRCSGHENCILF
ncbi:MAG: hypothetical protein Hyperionvirus5_39 [Hyperionvirus sp.]|uniref:Right handed beta helix domain-containing protein n=1 Tax=Hyperionvirus sp. TaxID=2487770 RepID=A0A3G5ABI7_9VIRU|nr:MAG: hypothetical protein Hyperionvirus5_39 [Hyperionvirus sp.]